MSAKSKRLGSLADVFRAESLEGTIRKIRLDQIQPSENQPRQDRKKAVEELAESLRKDGLLQPILVTKFPTSENLYKIIAGERRFHAAKSLGWQEIECKIYDRGEKEVYRLAVVENLQRENLSPFEEVDAFRFLKSEYGYTDGELGAILGKSRSYTTELLSISTLSSLELKELKKANVQNKNLLVQAAQASKKGIFKDFLSKLQSGEVKTVKDAKEFNQMEEETLPFSKIEKADSEKEAKKYSLKKTEKSLTLTSDDPEIISKAYKILKKSL